MIVDYDDVAGINALKAKNAAITDPLKEHVIVCYFSAGTLEPFRNDAKDFPASVLRGKMVD